ncbi:hypothetical protein R1T43_18030 [Alteromonas sp. CI.11.F.A3]|uniref:hypothetical protein n=1 Tax=Alteromonas sp. CI.11.F.A3 TaxID=3079555 RepID=UPI002942348F|nr:hypothetical protein [Alteromonas sp. CI.11.F.A3]WOI35824.1 hypothetical protein R1T43_11355 [Alteromonas sp. CI.11.F.A3]WOI37068.1 hypothetical protein R1T43_18030 [Alteromonas sp. CI.11.F.A3]
MSLIPEYWKNFIIKNELVGEYCEIPESADLSELDGGNLKLLDEYQILNEANEFYPGIAVKKFGYIPVASCSLGSGDPYFININDGVNGNLYRIYHDAEMIDDESYNMDEAANVVLADYADLLKYLCKNGN